MNIIDLSIQARKVDMPLVSIITVCYNSARTICDTIESIINQSYPNIEYIIVDGGSTDGTIEIIKRYEKYIHKLVSEPDEGIYDAMNKGIRMATGKLISIVNSDDYLESNAIEYIVRTYLKNDNAELLVGKVRVINEDRTIKYEVGLNDQAIQKSNYKLFMPHPASVITRDAYTKYHYYNTKYRICADHEFLMRLIYNDAVIITINQVLSNMRLGGISSRNVVQLFNEKRKIHLFYGQNPVIGFIQFFIGIIKHYIIRFFLRSREFRQLYNKYITNKMSTEICKL